ncbi:response regulator [Rhodoferax antarcticus ANT.BR]|uniref:Response regulator n=1 Tax=Rhodoferax antarcticus ANT.BR TaxID=1111071 RepID=A0A1Q8YJY5_9BURK|nr:response regulator [Rhodoferax antarcticus ANT.BR]
MLLVDDDRLILSTLASGLRHAGYRVSTAESAQDAEALLANGDRPDLAILDLQMPQVDGLALADRLRDFEHVAFVMFSAYSDAASVDKAVSLGALSYLVKPMGVAQMVPALEAALLRARELHSLHGMTAQLQNALVVERGVSLAVGITMVQYRLSRQAAFDVLRTAARTQRRKLADVAHAVLQAHEALTSG